MNVSSLLNVLLFNCWNLSSRVNWLQEINWLNILLFDNFVILNFTSVKSLGLLEIVVLYL